jgi:hypothetical protein
MKKFIDSVQQFIQKHPFRVFGIVLVVALMGTIALRVLTPQSGPATQSVQLPKFLATATSPLIENVALPASVSAITTPPSVYQASYAPQQFVSGTSQKIGLRQNIKFQNFYQNQDKSITLSEIQPPGTIHYFNTQVSSSNTVLFSQNTAVQYATDFFQKIGYSSSVIDIASPHIQYLKEGIEDFVNSDSPTGTMLLSYTPKINGSAAAVADQSTTQVLLYVNAAGVFKAVVPAPITRSGGPTTISPLSTNQVVKNIEGGLYEFLSPPADVAILSRSQTIQRLTINSLTLEYRLDPDQNALIPFYHFTAGIDLAGNSNLSETVEGITPAVATSTQ